MSTVGSTLKADAVEQQKLISAALASVRPGQTTATQVSPDEASISSVGRMRGSTIVVQDAVQALAQEQTWNVQRASSSQPEHVAATAASSTQTGVHEVQVNALAQPQVAASASFTSLSTVVGIGTLNIEMGHWSNTSSTFATNPNWPKASVTLGPRDNTLERVRDRINAAGVGVVAAVVSDATGSRLVLHAAKTGADNGFKVTAEPDVNAMPDAAPLSRLGFDPSTGDSQGMQLMQAAQDASLTVDGREMRSASNFVDDAESGLQLQLKRTTSGPGRIQVQPDDEPVQRRLQALSASVNDLRQQAVSETTEPMAKAARQEASSVLATVRDQLQGSQAPAWQAIGLSWDEQSGMQHQAVTWTPELRRTGQQLFSALNQQWAASGPEAQAMPESGLQAVSVASGNAAVALNRQRLQDQYSEPAAAPGEHARQDFAVF